MKNRQGNARSNSVTISIQSLAINESFARNAVAAFCTQLDPTVDQINDIKTAVSEAVTNAIVHGYDEDPNCIVTIQVQIEDSVVHIKVQDKGVGIPDIAQARVPLYSTKADQERSGMGLTVIESYMDTMDIKSDANGTLVTMTKKI
ncbi:MAG: anti-sigma F factor [Clostridiales bacterium]|jgi:stage II sporulation protein AB (anti-sigma F factor)|nr:anti-sigma F factor [Clostridiales bacterium]